MPKETYQFSVTMEYQQSIWVDANSEEEAKKMMVVSVFENDDEDPLYDEEIRYQLHDDWGDAHPTEIHHWNGKTLSKVDAE